MEGIQVSKTISRRPSVSLADPFSDFDNFVNRFFGPMKAFSDKSEFASPRVDISEKEDRYLVKADIPGVKKEDIHVSLHDGVLSIEAETKKEIQEGEDENHLRQERYYGKYLRRFNLGADVVEDEVNANLKDGVLTIEIPKQHEETTQQPRKIEVS